MEFDLLKIILVEENILVKFESCIILFWFGYIIKNGFKFICVIIYYEWGKKESLLWVD